MEIILKKEMPKLGLKDDIITVKNGYGRNYLIPKGYATLATVSAKKIHAENIKQRAHKEEKLKNQALEFAKKLEDVSLTIGTKTSSKGKIFGSVNTIQISESLKEKGFEIERKNITIDENQIKEVGNFKATIKLHREVKVEIPFEVVSE
ncbi:MAG: 50S ribosomal protein L9 [Bacteroidales bacterium]|jgi:large subunit ribosomal protein L9|nr:50S ribosomal protein L9 [Bacteroidales bacterium]